MSDSKRATFLCNVAAAREAAKVLTAFLAARGIPEEHLFACELALTEACNNAVQHAIGAQRQQELTAEASISGDEVHLAVHDHTFGFDYSPVPAPDPEIKSGRGLFLIQSMMDSLSYERGPGMNVMRMRKRIAATKTS